MSGKVLSLTENDIKNMCLDIANQITKDNWCPEVVVGVTRGGLQAAIYLSYWFGVPMETVKIQLADSKGQHSIDCTESICWLAEDAYGYNLDSPKRILVVDDINDSGTTFKWLIEDWESSCSPSFKHSRDIWDYVWHNTTRFASLASNIHSEFDIEYNSLDVDRDVISWVEFPWSVWWRR